MFINQASKAPWLRSKELVHEGIAVPLSFLTEGAEPTLGIFLEKERSTWGFVLLSTPVPRSFVAPFFVILKPGDEGVEGAVVIPLPCPICERDDRLFAEGDNVPLIFPIFCPLPFSFTIFLHDDNFNSNAPTFLKRSPTIFRALKRADGVRGGWWWALLLIFESVAVLSLLFESIVELLFFSEQFPTPLPIDSKTFLRLK